RPMRSLDEQEESDAPRAPYRSLIIAAQYSLPDRATTTGPPRHLVVFDASSRYLINEPGVEISVDRNGIAGPGVSPQYNCAWLPSLNNRVQRNLLPYDIDSIHVV